MSNQVPAALIVDDDASVRTLVAEWLRCFGYEPTEATSGQDALERLTSATFDVIMLDIHLPGTSGLQVLEQARPAQPDACIIMFSGMGQAQLFAEARAMGADATVTKPCTMAHLEAVICESQERRQRIAGRRAAGAA